MSQRVDSYNFYAGLLRSVKRQIREVQGPEPREIKNYYRQYARGLEKKLPVRSTEEEALEAMARHRVVLVGDFHTLDQAQKQFKKIVEGMIRAGHRPVLALEMVPARHDKVLQEYMEGSLKEGEFLTLIRYFDHWGFDFPHYRPLLEFVRDSGLAVHGINGGKKLPERDRFMADRIAALLKRYPDRPLMVLTGDLHLAPNHLPGELEKRGIAAAVIFQNSETVQMRKRKEGEDPVGWWRLSENRFLVNNTTPWVKMQTYLTWLEHGGEALFSLYGFCKWENPEDEEAVDLTETVFQYVLVLKDLLGLRLRADDDFQVFTLNDLDFLNNSYFKKDPGKTYARLIREGRALFLVWRNTIYIPILDVNRTVQEAAHFLMNRNLNIDEGRAAFHDRIHYYACGYLASKLVNPLRRTEDRTGMRKAIRDYGLYGPKDRAYLTRYRQTCLFALDFLNRMEIEQEIPSAYLSELTQKDSEFHFSIAEMLGRYLGENLYEEYNSGALSGSDLRSYVFIQRNPFSHYDFHSK